MSAESPRMRRTAASSSAVGTPLVAGCGLVGAPPVGGWSAAAGEAVTTPTTTRANAIKRDTGYPTLERCGTTGRPRCVDDLTVANGELDVRHRGTGRGDIEAARHRTAVDGRGEIDRVRRGQHVRPVERVDGAERQRVVGGHGIGPGGDLLPIDLERHLAKELI